nr:hypothetical protein [uncultured Schaedlerella sp.]
MKNKLKKCFYIEALVINIAILFFMLFILWQKLNDSFTIDCFEYRKYGISYNIISEQLKYKGKSVRYFEDNKLGKNEGTVVMQREGEYDVVIRRNNLGKIDEVKIYPKEQTLDRIESLYQGQGSYYFTE